MAIAVAAAAVVGLVAFIIPRLRGPAPSAPHGAVTPSIAVLPFADLSEHHDQQFLGDGLAVEILDQLQHIPGLRVIGRNSSFRFRGQAQDAPRIGATLGASYLLDGSVRRSLDRVRVNVELLAIGEGAPLWSKTYDVAAVDQFQLQDAIAIGVAHALKLTIAQIELERPRMKPEAYDLYLHALQTMDALSMEGWMRGIATLEDAARLDPDNSRIHGAISIGYGCAMMQGWPSPTEPYAAAMHHADLALKLDSRNAIAHATRGSMILAHDWDRRQGEAEMEEALRLGPKDPWVLFLGANFHAAVGHWARARQLSEALLAIDPLSSHAEFVLGAHILMPQGDYAGAVRHLSRAIQILPEYQTLRFCRAVALLQLGRAADALTEAQSLDPDEGRDVIAAIVLHNLKRKAESDAALVRATSVVGETWPYGVASMHAYRGEADAAMRWLEISYRTHGVDLYLIAGDPLFLPIAQDPRFQALLKRLNLRE